MEENPAQLGIHKVVQVQLSRPDTVVQESLPSHGSGVCAWIQGLFCIHVGLSRDCQRLCARIWLKVMRLGRIGHGVWHAACDGFPAPKGPRIQIMEFEGPNTIQHY